MDSFFKKIAKTILQRIYLFCKWIYHTLFYHAWWVFVFLFACLIFYERSLQERELLYQKLTEQLAMLQADKQKALFTQQNLRMQIDSQNDPVWLELTLLRVLGLVPEDQQKIYFSSSPDTELEN